MQQLSSRYGQEATKLPLLLKMNTFAKQLLMNEVEVSYWHGLVKSRPQIWEERPHTVLEKLLVFALFAKMHCTDPKKAEIFKTFILHNYRDAMRNHWREFHLMPEGDQTNWIRFVKNSREISPDEANLHANP